MLQSAALLAAVGAITFTGFHVAGFGSAVSGATGVDATGKAAKPTSSSGLPSSASSPSVATVPSASPTASPPHITSSPAKARSSPAFNGPPLAGRSYAGSLVLDATGSQLVPWNQTSTFCPGQSWQVADGTVATDSSGDATMETTGKTGSCVALISPGSYSSAVIEADIDFPALPGKSSTIANWTTLWLTDQATWPADGELDAAEVEPNSGVSAVTYHWGTTKSQQRISTDGGPPGDVLPVDGPNVTPGWHVVDIVYTHGYFAVYYDGSLYTSLNSSVITGAALNILITSSVTPDTSEIEQELDGPPINSDGSPATTAIKYVRVWSFK